MERPFAGMLGRGCEAEASAGRRRRTRERRRRGSGEALGTKAREKDEERERDGEGGRESGAAKHCTDEEATPPERRQTALSRAHPHTCARTRSIAGIQGYGAPSSGDMWEAGSCLTH